MLWLLLLLLAFPLQVVGAKFNDRRTPFFSHMPQMRPLLLAALPLLSFLIPASRSSPFLVAFVTAYCNRFAVVVVVVVVALGKKLYYTMRAESQFARYFPAKTSKQKQSNVQRYVYLILFFCSLLVACVPDCVGGREGERGRLGRRILLLPDGFCLFSLRSLACRKVPRPLRRFAHFQLHFPAWRIIILPKESGVGMGGVYEII